MVSSPLRQVDGRPGRNGGIVELERDRAREAMLLGRPAVTLTDFVLAPLAEGAPPVAVTLDLEPVTVFGPETRFIVADIVGPDGPLELAKPAVQMFGGSVRGVPDSNVFLSFADDSVNGFVRINQLTQVISSGPWGGGQGIYIFDPALLPQGVIRWRDFVCEAVSPGGITAPQTPVDKDVTFCIEILMAIETDYEFSLLFGGNVANSGAYVTTLMGAVSEIYTNTLSIHFRLGQVRLWATNTDPWSASNTSTQLTQFRDYYNANMSNVPRQLTHFLSGRNLGGGIAYLGVVCNTSLGYGLSANLSGHFPYPIVNNSQNWDLNVTAHEIGHNCGSSHTHDYCPPADQCPPQGYWGNCQNAQVCSNAGTIMSYCHLCAGGMSNIVMQFHPVCVHSIANHLNGLSCDVLCGGVPVVDILTPEDSAIATFGTPVLFSGTATDSDDGDLTSGMTWVSSLQGEIGTGGFFSRNDLEVGTHTIAAQSRDSAGNVGANSVTLTITPPPNTPPSVAITSPASGSSYIWGTPITFTGTATDPQSGNLSSSIVWLSNVQGQLGTGASCTSSALFIGSHTITARCTDPGNMIGTATINVIITPSATNSPPAVTINSPINNSSHTFGQQIGFSGTASDPQDGNLTSVIAWSSSIQGSLGVGGYVPRSDLAIGTHVITAEVVDSGALHGQSTVTIIVTPPPPATDGRTKSDIPVSGTVTGTFKRTHNNDLRYESIEEVKSNGIQIGRYSFLDHRWTIDVPNIQGTRTFFIKAHHTVSVDGDDFTFEYSTNGINYLPMLTVTKTADDGMFQTFTIPAWVTGKVYIRTRDTDHTIGNKQVDTLFVDQMFIRVQ